MVRDGIHTGYQRRHCAAYSGGNDAENGRRVDPDLWRGVPDSGGMAVRQLGMFEL